MKLNTTSTIALAALLTLAAASAQVPAILNYQGRVSIGGSNYNGTGLFKFALVNSNGTEVFWNNAGAVTTNEPANAVSLVVAQGLYSVLVGDTSLGNMATIPQTVFTNSDLRLRVWFSPGPDGIFMPFSPDQRLGAAAYAMRAAAADNANPTNISGNLTVSGVLSAGQLIGGSNNTASAFTATIGGGVRNTASGFHATIGGGLENTASLGFYATVGGGANNTNTGFSGTIGGGMLNTASGDRATIGGGNQNTASGTNATIGGGFQNTNSGDAATIAGGYANTASGLRATIGGGMQNTASGEYGTVPGGLRNSATNYAFAAGRRAKATNDGAFVWADSTDADFFSLGTNTFNVRASGGVFLQGDTNSGRLSIFPSVTDKSSQILLSENNTRTLGMILRYDGTTNNNPLHIIGLTSGVESAPILTVSRTFARVGVNQPSPTATFQVVNATCDGSTWVNSSDRDLKTSFKSVDGAEILRKVAGLPISEWTYKTSTNGARHVGPTAQDFRAAFGLGNDDKTISTVDPSGVALAAIQGLVNEIKLRDTRIERLEAELGEIRRQLNNLPPAP